MLWLYDLPSWQLAFLSALSFSALGWLGLLLIRPPLRRRGLAQLIDNGTVGWFFSAVAIFYGLLLGLLTVATWQTYTQDASLASQEAAQLAVLYRDLGGYGAQERIALRVQLKRYTQHIILLSWPRQRQGLIDDEESIEFLRLQTRLLAYQPDTLAHQLIHQQALEVFNTLAELRRLRAEAISGGIPAVIWWVVLLGALVLVVLASLFVVPSEAFHVLLNSLLGSMLGLLIFLLIVMDHPYWGEFSVGVRAYELTLEKVMATY